jgi:hypothetical protein
MQTGKRFETMPSFLLFLFVGLSLAFDCQRGCEEEIEDPICGVDGRNYHNVCSAYCKGMVRYVRYQVITDQISVRMCIFSKAI